ncbi:MAG: MerR family transcriptional regulator [Defluviitaleaceae bacterium]|nr:MerR family transcriptional regulator [Defluviitaleaceae bacterium]
MEKHKAIPDGYMRIGEMAKKAGVTVRTLQYYHKEGILSPSAESEGGFRLYTDKDMVKLIRILTMKEWGFSLSEIKRRLPNLDTPADVINALTEQATDIRKEIEVLSDSLEAIQALKVEIAQMEVVDFDKYAKILINLQLKNKYYWAIKHFDNEMMEQIGENLDFDLEKAKEIVDAFGELNEEAVKLHMTGATPEGEEGQNLAKRIGEMMLQLTGGNTELMEKLSEQMEKVGTYNTDWDEQMTGAMKFMEKAAKFYFEGDAQND